MEVRVSKIRNAGLGVFATKKYKKNELIERSGFVYVEKVPDDLVPHCFESGDSPPKNIVYFGKMTLINHAKIDNVSYEQCEICKRVMEFYTTKEINIGEEFLMDYCYGEDKDPWADTD